MGALKKWRVVMWSGVNGGLLWKP